MITAPQALVTTTLETMTINYEQVVFFVLAVSAAFILWMLRGPLLKAATVAADGIGRVISKLGYLLLALFSAVLWHAIVRIIVASILFIAARYYGLPTF